MERRQINAINQVSMANWAFVIASSLIREEIYKQIAMVEMIKKKRKLTSKCNQLKSL